MTNDVLTRVEQALNLVRPHLLKDGGNVEVVGITDRILNVRLLGNCSTCQISLMTLKAGIEETVKQEIPEIDQVIAV